MTKKGNLFQLIKSLSRAEKRYITLFAGQREDAVYLRLFDAIDEQEVYDEELIRQQFSGSAFLNQLHVTKIYLTELILKALRNYHAKKTVQSELLVLLGDIEILFQRELYDLCASRIEKAERLAAAYEKLDLLQAVLGWKRKLLLVSAMQDMQQAAAVTKYEQQVLDRAATQNRYWEYTLNVFRYSKKPGQLLKHPLFATEASAATLRSKILRYHVLYSLHLMNGEPNYAEQALDELVATLEQVPQRIEEDPAPYITAIGNKTGLLLQQKRWKETEVLIATIRRVAAGYQLAGADRLSVRLWLRLYNVELEMYRDSLQLSRGKALAAEVNSFIDKHDKLVPADYRLLIYYQLAHIYFLDKDFDASLKWLNRILNGSFDSARTDIQAYTRLLNLAVHFELDNIIVMRYALDAARRFFKKHRMLDEYMTEVLSLFSKLGHAAAGEYKEVFKAGYSRLFDADSTLPGNQLDYFNIREWIQGKIRR